MLEPLVSSRIRRTLLEFLIAHPNDRFYLRGLSKELGLSVSPLRRELKRLERSGMLQTVAEGNILFYRVNAQSPAFQQLCSLQAFGQPIAPGVASPSTATIASGLPPAHAVRNFSGRRRLQFSLVAAAMTLAAAAGLYFGVSRHKTQVTVIVPATPLASGAMRGGHWRVVPGNLGGGFSSESSNAESY